MFLIVQAGLPNYKTQRHQLHGYLIHFYHLLYFGEAIYTLPLLNLFIPLLSRSLQPLHSLVCQCIVHAEGFAGGPAAAASDAVIGLNVNRAMLI